ncbi:MAG: DinB family protein [Saprospiraceae bacterium]|nr:DinB family protein [Saprospiraceae bacterium]
MSNILPTKLNGSKLALLSEYRKAIDELIAIIQTISSIELHTIIDTETNDDDCRSIQTILSHVVCSGFGYIIYVENWVGLMKERPEKRYHTFVQQYIEDLNIMYEYSLNFFQNHPTLEMEQIDNDQKIKVNWGQCYDVEQLMEHAIVHVLRHRRQIEKFKERLNYITSNT